MSQSKIELFLAENNLESKLVSNKELIRLHVWNKRKEIEINVPEQVFNAYIHERNVADEIINRIKKEFNTDEQRADSES